MPRVVGSTWDVPSDASRRDLRAVRRSEGSQRRNSGVHPEVRSDAASCAGKEALNGTDLRTDVVPLLPGGLRSLRRRKEVPWAVPGGPSESSLRRAGRLEVPLGDREIYSEDDARVSAYDQPHGRLESRGRHLRSIFRDLPGELRDVQLD